MRLSLLYPMHACARSYARRKPIRRRLGNIQHNGVVAWDFIRNIQNNGVVPWDFPRLPMTIPTS